MGIENGSSASGSARWWIRAEQPSLAFVWWGLLPLLGLLIVAGWGMSRFAKQTIEAAASGSITQALRARGLDWVNVVVDGQRVHLSGFEPAPGGAGDEALAVARAAKCPTWAGPLTCAVEVDGRFERPAQPSDSAQWPRLEARSEGGALKVRGAAPDEAARARLEAACRGLEGPRFKVVTCDVVTTGAPAPAGFEALDARVLEVIAQCERGTATAVGGVFSASCDVSRATAAAVEASARAPLDGGALGTLAFLVKEDVEACEAALSALVTATRLEFEVASAVVAPSARGVLDRIAAVAKDCPGTLRIEGHTDALGTLEANTALSQARADAVKAALVERGVDAGRLVTLGQGPTRPLDTNDTAPGRARNRRIEFHVERPTGETP